jgi:hypothetical protein
MLPPNRSKKVPPRDIVADTQMQLGSKFSQGGNDNLFDPTQEEVPVEITPIERGGAFGSGKLKSKEMLTHSLGFHPKLQCLLPRLPADLATPLLHVMSSLLS